MTKNDGVNGTHLFMIVGCRLAGPEEMGAHSDAAALVWLLQQLGCGQRALRPQRLVILLSETGHLLDGGDDQRYGCQLRFAVRYLFFVE